MEALFTQLNLLANQITPVIAYVPIAALPRHNLLVTVMGALFTQLNQIANQITPVIA
jgi:hypothetical protein